MTRKDYELVAQIMQETVLAYPDDIDVDIRAALRMVVSTMSAAFMADNPRFDPDKFTRACGF